MIVKSSRIFVESSNVHPGSASPGDHATCRQRRSWRRYQHSSYLHTGRQLLLKLSRKLFKLFCFIVLCWLNILIDQFFGGWMFVRGTFDCLISQIIAEFEGSCYNTKASNEPPRRLKFHNHALHVYFTCLGTSLFSIVF